MANKPRDDQRPIAWMVGLNLEPACPQAQGCWARGDVLCVCAFGRVCAGSLRWHLAPPEMGRQ